MVGEKVVVGANVSVGALVCTLVGAIVGLRVGAATGALVGPEVGGSVGAGELVGLEVVNQLVQFGYEKDAKNI